MNESTIASLIDRRAFIKTGVLASGGILLAPSLSFGQAPSSTLNVAIVGMGVQGRILLEAMLNIPGLRFQAVCDIWEYSRTYGQRKLKSEGHEANAYENIEDMLAKEKDLAINQDMFFISFANFPIWDHIENKPMASIEQFPDKQGAKAAEILFDLIHQGETGKENHIVYPSRLVHLNSD